MDSLETSFKNLLYDFYSRDLSRKIRNAKKFRAQRGDFLSRFAPYGYIKDPSDKNHLVIDPEAAETVRRIFHLMAAGKRTEQIAAILNHDAVLTPMRYKLAAGCSYTKWYCIREDNFWTVSAVTKILRDERYIGKNVYGKRLCDMVGHSHTVKVSRTDWIVVENTHEGIVTREEFNRAQAAMRAFREHNGSGGHDWPLPVKIRCGVCGYAMAYTKGRQRYFYCHTPRVNTAYTCAGRTPENEILEAVKKGLHVQALMAVELRRLWEEQHRTQKKDFAAMKKNLAALREKHGQLCRQIKGLYESFALGEISKPEYLAAKEAAVGQRDTAAARISELEAALENMGSDGGLKNSFVSVFEKYMDVVEITSEIVKEVLSEIRIYPDSRLEIIWNFRDELDNLALDLQGNNQGQ